MHEEEGKNIVVLMAAKCICIHGVCGGHALCRIWTAAILQLSFLLPTEKVSADNCISLFASLVLHAWTHQEVRGMMHHLKERGRRCNNSVPVSIMHTLPAGMNSFIKEYVLVRNIPIPKLLYAFGICLVSQLLHWLATQLQAVSSCYRPLIFAHSDIVRRTTHETP
jgi:hypothetical protein